MQYLLFLDVVENQNAGRFVMGHINMPTPIVVYHLKPLQIWMKIKIPSKTAVHLEKEYLQLLLSAI